MVTSLGRYTDMIYRGTGGGLVDVGDGGEGREGWVDMGDDVDIDIEVGEPLLVQIEG